MCNENHVTLSCGLTFNVMFSVHEVQLAYSHIRILLNHRFIVIAFSSMLIENSDLELHCATHIGTRQCSTIHIISTSFGFLIIAIYPNGTNYKCGIFVET